MRIARAAVPILTLAVAGFLLAACGGGSGGVKTYANDTYRFSLSYDGSTFTQTSDTSAQGSAGGSSVFDVGFVDKNGTKTSDEYRDGVLLSVYKLTTNITPSMMPLVKGELGKLMPQLLESLGSDGEIGALQDAEAGGVQGFSADATFSMDGVPFKARLYFLINGELEYQITLQAAEDRWADLEPKFQQVIDGFTATPAAE